MVSYYRDPPRDRYERDVEFRALVDMMRAMIHRSQFSPSEMREAAILACTMYEMMNARPVKLSHKDLPR